MTFRIVLITLMLWMWSSAALGDEKFVADLDQDNVFITTDFTGAELLLFGALEHAGIHDIAIIVTGPAKTITIRRKDQVTGIWLNTKNIDISGLPSFHHILTTRPLEQIASPSTLKVNRIGFDHILFRLDSKTDLDGIDVKQWKDALVRNMKESDLWSNQSGQIKVINNVLFRANISLPANVAPGEYKIRTLHFHDRAVVNENISTITVSKRGLSATIYQFAHEYAPFYGIFAIIFAVCSGWIAAVAFRK